MTVGGVDDDDDDDDDGGEDDGARVIFYKGRYPCKILERGAFCKILESQGGGRL